MVGRTLSKKAQSAKAQNRLNGNPIKYPLTMPTKGAISHLFPFCGPFSPRQIAKKLHRSRQNQNESHATHWQWPTQINPKGKWPSIRIRLVWFAFRSLTNVYSEDSFECDKKEQKDEKWRAPFWNDWNGTFCVWQWHQRMTNNRCPRHYLRSFLVV